MQDHVFRSDNLTALVVDDQDPMRKAIKRVLHAMGFQNIVESSDGAGAKKAFREQPVDLVISDIYMKTTSGFDLLQFIRSRDAGSDVPVIMVTGEGSKDDIVKAVDLGANDYVLKPFQADDLEKKVTKTMAEYLSPPPLLRALRQGDRHAVSRQLPSALKCFDEALRLDPASMRARHAKAITLSALGRVEEAHDLLWESIGISQSYYKNYAALADIYLKRGMEKEAMNVLKRELDLNPKQAARQVLMARMLLKAGDPEGAAEHFRQALKEQPSDRAALLGMASALATANNLEKAIYYCKRARRSFPDLRASLEAIVKYCLESNEPRRAEMVLRDERRAFPERQDTYVVLAKLYLATQQDKAAKETAEDAAKRFPDNLEIKKILGLLRFNEKDYPGSIAIFLDVAAAEPTAELFAALAECYLALQQPSEAMSTLMRALRLNCSSAPLFALLGEAHRLSGQPLKAYLLFTRAKALGLAENHEYFKHFTQCRLALVQRRKQQRRFAS